MWKESTVLRRFQNIPKIFLIGLILGGLMAAGCAKQKSAKTAPADETSLTPAPNGQAAPRTAIDQSVKEMIATLQATKVPYTGNLTPEKAAEITNSVAKVSLAEIPSKDLPKDPKVMVEINDRIRQKSDAVYSQYGTTMGDVMRYISDLAPQDREKYNKRLTDLFLEDSKKRAENASKGTMPPTSKINSGKSGK
jgi:hypothetical protein